MVRTDQRRPFRHCRRARGQEPATVAHPVNFARLGRLNFKLAQTSKCVHYTPLRLSSRYNFATMPASCVLAPREVSLLKSSLISGVVRSERSFSKVAGGNFDRSITADFGTGSVRPGTGCGS